LPQASVARHVRVAVKVFPQVLFVVVLTMTMAFVPQVSLAVGASNVHGSVHSTVLALAQVMMGGVVSTTVTVWLHCAVFPQPSVARQVRVAMNALPQVPLVVVLTMVMVLLVPQVSVAVGVSNVQGTVHSTVLLLAQLIIGAVVSTTVTVWLHCA
jgi:hypothetical protein